MGRVAVFRRRKPTIDRQLSEVRMITCELKPTGSRLGSKMSESEVSGNKESG